MKSLFLSSLGLAVCLSAFTASGAVVWDESVQGNLSNNRMAPTSVAFAGGDNTIRGTLTGNFGDGTYYDYVTFVVPAGYAVMTFTFDSLSSSNNGATLLGLAAGTTFPADANGTNINQTLGWTSISPGGVGIDLLPNLAVADHSGYGNSGFTVPLGAGTYTLWVQDYNTPASYQYTILLEPTTPPDITIGKKTVKKNKAVIEGTASGAKTTVTYRVGTKGRFKTARVVSSKWTIKAGLKPGNNIITVRATGSFGTSTKKIVVKVKS